MKSLILLALLGVTLALPQGFYLNDTPDVKAEKHRFYTLYNSMAAAAEAAPDIHIYSSKRAPARAYTPRYQAQPQVQAYAAQGPIGAPAFTPDVQAATAQFYRAYQDALKATLPKSQRQSYAGFSPAVSRHQPRWTGPVAATVPASLPGSSPVVADTAEVQAAKAAFANAFQHQLRRVMNAPSNAYA